MNPHLLETKRRRPWWSLLLRALGVTIGIGTILSLMPRYFTFTDRYTDILVQEKIENLHLRRLPPRDTLPEERSPLLVEPPAPR